MNTRQSNNIIPVIHRLVTPEYGENYWFNGCAKYVMECLCEPDYDYWFFAGLTGDIFTQHYTYTKYSGDALTSYMLEENMGGNPVKFVEETFAKCGYAATYVSNQDLAAGSTSRWKHCRIKQNAIKSQQRFARPLTVLMRSCG